MCKHFSGLASIAVVLSLFTAVGNAQFAIYEFDGGGDGSSWDDPANWAIIQNPDGSPGASNDPASPPDITTDTEIPMLGVVVDNTMPGQTSDDVRIGTTNGPGSLTISGGDLTSDDDFDIGNDGIAGTMMMFGGTASMSDDLTIRTDSSLNMTDGTILIGDRLNMEDNATLTLDDGTIRADDDFFFFDAALVTVNGGLMEVQDKLRFDDTDTTGLLTINGGVVRAQEYGFEDDFGAYIMNGVTEINGNGVLQIELNDGTDPVSQLTLASAKAMIAEGIHLTTSEPSPLKLGARLITVPDFFGSTNVPFVEILVVPEPSSALLLGFGGLALLLRRKKAR